jgi:elongation factor P
MSTATMSGMTKPSLLSYGVVVLVPDFVKQGERVRVDPREGKYLERAK